jgi:hypothetical protein
MVSCQLKNGQLPIHDMAAKRREKHKNKISGLLISMGYETEIREF